MAAYFPTRAWALACGATLVLAFGGAASAQPVGGDIEPAWSPNGKQIAFARDIGGHGEIYVMNATGGGARALTHGAPNHFDPMWSPDGKTIAYSRITTSHGQTLSGQVEKVPASGGASTQVTNGTGGYDEVLGWSPDGTQIAFERIVGGVGAVFVTGKGGPRQVTAKGEDGYLGAWSPNGQKIAFVQTAKNAFGDIWVMNADGTGAHALVIDRGDDTDPRWAPNGKQIAYASSKTAHYEIYTVGAAGGSRQVSHENGDAKDPAWSPDSTKIAFSTEVNGQSQIAVVNATGAGQRTLTNSSGDNTNPVWSPSGKQIAFESTRGGHSAVFVMNADGSGQHGIS